MLYLLLNVVLLLGYLKMLFQKNNVFAIILLSSALMLSGCIGVQTEMGPPPVTLEQTIPDTHSGHAVVTSEKEFIQSMIPHHQEAVDTSKLVVAHTQDVQLKTFAQNVITVQNKEITQMKKWLSEWYEESNPTSGNYTPMMGDLTSLQGSELDRSYIEGMIEHHLGAIAMAQQVLKLNPRPEVTQMANDIINTQQAEVATLQSWLSGNKLPASTQLPDHTQIEH